MTDIGQLPVPPIRADGLQMQEYRDRQRRYWRIQRMGWWGFGAIMLLAILGLTGSGGVFQTQTLRFADATVEVPRVSRWEGTDGVSIVFAKSEARHEVRIGQPFFDRFSIRRIQPEPDRNLLIPGAQSLAFTAEGPGPHQVRMDLRALHFGWTAFDITIGNETRRASLIVLP